MSKPLHPMIWLAIIAITAIYSRWAFKVYRESRRRRQENEDYERFYGDYDLGI